nr:hypothetical protein Iba_chr04aCG6330 [Ipomoea batatas]
MSINKSLALKSSEVHFLGQKNSPISPFAFFNHFVTLGVTSLTGEPLPTRVRHVEAPDMETFVTSLVLIETFLDLEMPCLSSSNSIRSSWGGSFNTCTPGPT